MVDTFCLQSVLWPVRGASGAGRRGVPARAGVRIDYSGAFTFATVLMLAMKCFYCRLASAASSCSNPVNIPINTESLILRLHLKCTLIKDWYREPSSFEYRYVPSILPAFDNVVILLKLFQSTLSGFRRIFCQG